MQLIPSRRGSVHGDISGDTQPVSGDADASVDWIQVAVQLGEILPVPLAKATGKREQEESECSTLSAGEGIGGRWGHAGLSVLPPPMTSATMGASSSASAITTRRPRAVMR